MKTESKTQGQHCEAPKGQRSPGLGSSTVLLLVASGTCRDSGDVGDKADGVKVFLNDLQSFPNPSYPECRFCGFCGDVMNGRASGGWCVLGRRDQQEQSHPLAPITSLSK